MRVLWRVIEMKRSMETAEGPLHYSRRLCRHDQAWWISHVSLPGLSGMPVSPPWPAQRPMPLLLDPPVSPATDLCVKVSNIKLSTIIPAVRINELNWGKFLCAHTRSHRPTVRKEERGSGRAWLAPGKPHSLPPSAGEGLGLRPAHNDYLSPPARKSVS